MKRTILAISLCLFAVLAIAQTPPAPSPNGTDIPPATAIVDCTGTTWTLVGGVVYMKPSGAAAATPAGQTANGTLIQISNCVVSYQNGPNATSPPWSAWSWINGAWVTTAVPLPTMTPAPVCPPVTPPVVLPNWSCQLDMSANPPTLTCVVTTTT
jgi:hypothetical protein